MQFKFIKSIFNYEDRSPKELPQVIFLGRSNVGKSSLINSLSNRKQMAKVSQMPGKTQSLNLFEINESLYLVDAPGYGYSRRSKEITETFSTLIESYVIKEPNLVKFYLLMDFKVGPTDLDIGTFRSLLKFNLPVAIVFTKIDKVNQSQRAKTMNKIKEHFPYDEIYYVSNNSKKGINLLQNDLLSLIKTEEEIK